MKFKAARISQIKTAVKNIAILITYKDEVIYFETLGILENN